MGGDHSAGLLIPVLAIAPAPPQALDQGPKPLSKTALYAAMGVPEFWRFNGRFWRFNGRVWRIYQLRDGGYGECNISPTFPMVAKDDLYQFLTTCQTDEVAAEINFRTWLRTQINNPSSIE